MESFGSSARALEIALPFSFIRACGQLHVMESHSFHADLADRLEAKVDVTREAENVLSILISGCEGFLRQQNEVIRCELVTLTRQSGQIQEPTSERITCYLPPGVEIKQPVVELKRLDEKFLEANGHRVGHSEGRKVSDLAGSPTTLHSDYSPQSSHAHCQQEYHNENNNVVNKEPSYGSKNDVVIKKEFLPENEDNDPWGSMDNNSLSSASGSNPDNVDVKSDPDPGGPDIDDYYDDGNEDDNIDLPSVDDFKSENRGTFEDDHAENIPVTSRPGVINLPMKCTAEELTENEPSQFNERSIPISAVSDPLELGFGPTGNIPDVAETNDMEGAPEGNNLSIKSEEEPPNTDCDIVKPNFYPGLKNTLKCSSCDKTFFSKMALNQHNNIYHVMKKEKSTDCDSA